MGKKRYVKLVGLLLAMAMVCSCGETEKEAKGTEQPQAIQVVDLPKESFATLQDGVYTATGGAMQINVPAEWTLSEADATVLVAGKEEDTKDCLTVQVTDKDPAFATYEIESFEKVYNSLLDNYEAVSYEQTTVAGLPAGCLEYTFSTDTNDVIGYEYFIDGNYTYMLSFIDVSGKLKEQIPEILENVTICK